MRDEQETDGRGVPKTSLTSVINLTKSSPGPLTHSCPFHPWLVGQLLDSLQNSVTSAVRQLYLPGDKQPGPRSAVCCRVTHRRGDNRFWFQKQSRPLSPKIPTPGRNGQIKEDCRAYKRRRSVLGLCVEGRPLCTRAQHDCLPDGCDQMFV